MPERLARVETLALPQGGRTLVVSDIHGNLPYLRGLLKLADFAADDLLLVDGDFLEKGPDSLGTLRFLMALTARGQCRALLGNCDGWHELFALSPEADRHVLDYLQRRRCALLWEMLRGCDIDPLALTELASVKPLLSERFAAEFAYLASLPDAIESERAVFVHAGCRPDKPLRAHTARELNHRDAFLHEGFSFDRWVVVGHWPVMLYGENTVSAAPILDDKRHIACIDGGCVLKDDGQLNALVIPGDGGAFSFLAYDPFPVRHVKTAQVGGARSYYIRWGDNEVEVLRRGAEFSLCRHRRTGYEMEILTKYLYDPGTLSRCNDCTDYILPLSAGDEVRVVEETSRGYFVKHDGVSGWYYGDLL